MLGLILQTEVDNYYRRVKQTNPLFLNAERGKVGASEVSRYIENILYLVRHTPIHLKFARQKAQERGLVAIAKFYRAKLGEESGHDQWAEQDLARLSKTFGTQAKGELAPSMIRLVEYLNGLIVREPAHYLAYVFFAEYFTVIAAPEWLEALEKKCGIPASMLSVLGNHVELDKDHVLKDVEVIEKLVSKDATNLPALVEVIRTAMGFHEKFCLEVGDIVEVKRAA